MQKLTRYQKTKQLNDLMDRIEKLDYDWRLLNGTIRTTAIKGNPLCPLTALYYDLTGVSNNAIKASYCAAKMQIDPEVTQTIIYNADDLGYKLIEKKRLSNVQKRFLALIERQS